MNSKGSFRAHVCLTATTALFAGGAWSQASANLAHKVKHGQTVESIARDYHVALKSLLAANDIKSSSILRDGRKLVIPDSHKSTKVPGSARRGARIIGDHISLRTGPSTSRERVSLCDDGAKVVVTAKRDGWLHVRLSDGQSGWVRSDFVHGACTSLAAHSGSKRHEQIHAHQTAAKIQRHASESASAALRRHEKANAHNRHAHHLMQAVAAKQQAHLTAAEVHRRLHEENVAHARKLKRLHELASAKHRHHSDSVVHKLSHHQNEALANYLHRQQIRLARRNHQQAHHAAIAHQHSERTAVAHKLSHHQNEALANYLHREQLKLARRKHQEATHEEVAHSRTRRQNEALANYLRRQQVRLENRKHRAEVAVTDRSASGRYSHHIRPEAESPSASNDVVRSAFAYRGTPYRWGSSRPGGFDCSGFTKYIYGRKGVSLPRTAAEQYHAGRAVGHRSMKPGDLVFFHTTRSGISHVGMYVGSGKFVHSSSSKSGGVRVDNLESGYYSKAFRGARRVRKETNEPSGE